MVWFMSDDNTLQDCKVSIKTSIDPELQIIKQEAELTLGNHKQYWNKIMQLQEEGTRQALIKLGWTPPPDTSK